MVTENAKLSAVLSGDGASFDVDAFLDGCTLPIASVWRKGEPVFPASQPQGRRQDLSGVSIVASDADFGEFRLQVSEAVTFLTTEFDQLRRLSEWPGVEGVTLDFGIWRRDVVVQCDIFPRELVRLAGALGLDLELSQYPPAEAEESS